MAKRPIFKISQIKPYYICKDTEFVFCPGFAVSQKQKSITNLHNAYLKDYPNDKILEISSKSMENLGIALSAFNLTIKLSDGREVSVETAFQSSKVFENGGPYKDLLLVSSREAKKDERIRNSGEITSFEFEGKTFPTKPKTMFYNWLYVNALNQHPDLAKSVVSYSAFTDIEFNPQKSINCQAIAAALFVSLSKNNLLAAALQSFEDFYKITGESESQNEQLSLFN